MKNPRLLLLLSLLCVSLFAGSCEYREYRYGAYPRGSTTVVAKYRPGYYTRSLPSGYRTYTYGGNRYYYHNNVYYRPQRGGYVVVDNPRGRADANVTVIRTLPRGYRTVNYRGVRYYQYGDAFYQPYSGGYRVVASPYGSGWRWR